MRYSINLATRIYINTSRLNFLVVSVIALLVFFLLFNASNSAKDLKQLKELNQKLDLLEGKAGVAKGATINEKEYQSLLSRIKLANSIIEEKTFDWLMLLDRLEAVVPEGIALVSIEPSSKDGGLKLAGIAKNFGDLRKYMENLEDSRYFTDVYLVSQSDSQQSDGRQGVSFNITCKAIYK
jgi:type IV pilus assembly protein PilN